ncbi:hypothetical protein NEIRO03_0065 [Nematocida sp. AWRm78]|nr:hypothetical protein NEIRO03_0065 [Nematocida sp. AWRm78]
MDTTVIIFWVYFIIRAYIKNLKTTMAQLRALFIIFGILWNMHIEMTICTSLKTKSKKSTLKNNQENKLPHNKTFISRRKRPPTESTKDMMLFAQSSYKSTCVEQNNRNMESSDINVQPEPIDTYIAHSKRSTTIPETSGDIEVTSPLNHTQEENSIGLDEYLEKDIKDGQDNIELDPSVSLELLPKDYCTISQISKNKDKHITFSIYQKKRKYIVRNYTDYKPVVNNLIIFSYRNGLLSKSIKEYSQKIIDIWKKEKNTNIWIMILNLNTFFLKKMLIFKAIIKIKDIEVNNFPKKAYYNSFLEDLVEYIDTHSQTIYRYNEIASTRTYTHKKETLGTILANKEVSLYCCCSGIDRQMDIEGTEEDIKIKKILNSILLIPEVYEDFYKIPIRVINEFFRVIKEDLEKKVIYFNIELQRYTNKLALLELECVIKYLIGLAQKDTDLLTKSYKKINELKIDQKSIHNYSIIQIYSLVYKSVYLFYMHFGEIYKISKAERAQIKNRTSIMHMRIHATQLFNKTLGTFAVANQKYLRLSVILKEIIQIEDKISVPHIIMLHSVCQPVKNNNILLKIQDHYHIQFVNNVKHTIEVIHIPFYIYKKENGETVHRSFHTINTIIDHLKNIFKIGNDKKDILGGGVYPFKYSIETKTWSLITTENDLNKTIQMIEDKKCNVVFYYIKENIYKTEFCFAQFFCPNSIKHEVMDENIDKPRIPLFFPRLMVSAATIGPYKKNCNKYRTRKTQNYTNLKPISYIYNYTNSSEGKAEINKTKKVKVCETDDIFNSCYYTSTDSELDSYESSSDKEKEKDIESPLDKSSNKKRLEYVIKYYYSDFFIRKSTDFYEDPHCYCMDIQQKIDKNNKNIYIIWSNRVYSSVYEYTTYKFDRKIKDERAHMSAIKQPAHASFISMLQRKNPSLNTALYGHCIYKTYTNVNYKTIPIFCLTMKDLLEWQNAYLMDLNSTEKLYLKSKKCKLDFTLRDISDVIKNKNLEAVKKSNQGIISIRDNNYNGCKYGIHYDIFNILF